MAKAKIAITIEEDVLKRLDQFVQKKAFPNRSQAIEEAVLALIDRLERSRLAEECAKLDPRFEKALAEEGMSGEAGTARSSTSARKGGSSSREAGTARNTRSSTKGSSPWPEY